jgi:hypothetical protein
MCFKYYQRRGCLASGVGSQLTLLSESPAAVATYSGGPKPWRNLGRGRERVLGSAKDVSRDLPTFGIIRSDQDISQISTRLWL